MRSPSSAAATAKFVLSGLPATATAGTPTTFTVTAEDSFGNITPAYTGTVAITSNDPAAVLPANNTLTGGVGTFTVTLKTAGQRTVTATDTNNSTLSQSSNPITVNPAATAQFVLSGLPATATAGTPTTFTVTAEDSFGNITPAYTGTVAITSNDPAAVLPANNTLTGGVGTFTVTLKTAGQRTVTATDTNNSTLSQSSNPITVNPAATSKFVFFGVPATATAGTPTTFTVTAEDDFGNITPAYTGTVAITSNDPAAVLPASNTLIGGVGTFTVTLKTAGQRTVTATDTNNAALSQSSNAITVSAAATAQFVLSGLPATTTAGTLTTFTVTAEDDFGNITPAYSGNVAITSSDPAAVLSASNTLTGGVGTFTVTLKTAGQRTVTATDTNNAALSQSSNAITVSATATAKFVLSGLPATATAGTPTTFTVTAEDSFGNITPAYTGTVAITSNDPAALLPASNTLIGGVGTFTVTLKTAGQRTVTATDTNNAALSQSSNAITVSAAATAQFVLSGLPATTTAGTLTTFTVTAEDSFGNITPAYTGTVAITSNDPAASLPASDTLIGGVGTFTVTLKTAGQRTVTATDTNNAALSQSSNAITVSAVATAQFVLSGLPVTTTAGTLTTFTVTAEDSFGNITPAYTGTVAITSNDPAAVLSASNTLTGGVGTFTVTLKTAGQRTVTATDTNNAALSQSSNAITVSAAATAKFVLSGLPATATAGTLTTFTVTAEDSFGNITPAYTGTVAITSNDPAASLPASDTLIGGVGTFTVTLKTAGQRTVTATDTNNAALSQSSNAITVSAAATAQFVLSGLPATTTAGTLTTFTVTAEDSFGNITPAYTGTVAITSNDPAASLPASDTLIGGVGTFTVTLKTAGQRTVTATDTNNAALSQSSNAITVSAAATAQFVLSGLPVTTTAGTLTTFTVTAEDSFGNITPAYTGTVAITSNDPAAVLSASNTLTGGVGTFTVTLKTAGQRTVTATDTNNAALSQSSNAITVSAAATAQFVLSAVPVTTTAGVATSFAVTAEDTFGNITSGYTGTVKITSSDPAAVLPTSNTLTGGVGTFTVTLKTAGLQTLTAADTTNGALSQTSNPITVGAAATSQFVLSGVPATATAGVATSFTVRAEDNFGNLTPAYSGSVKITSSDLAASLPASHMLAAGVGTFTVTLKTAGLQTLTATDTVNSTLSQTSNPITVIAGAATQYKISAPATEVAGQPINFTVTALDSFGNTATSYTGTVGFTTSSALDTLPSPATLSSGQGVFTATLNSAGTQTITATDTMTSSIVVGTSNNITVTPGATTNFAIVGTPSILVAGSNATFTVTAEDTFGNITTAYSGSVKITSSDLAASLPASHTLTAGVGTFTVTLKTAGLQTLTATDTANSTLSQISNPITVSAAATAQLVLSGVPANATAGAAISFTVTAEDTFGNLTPTFAGSIKITSSDPAASLPASHTLVAGVGTFTVTLKTAGLQTLTAADTVTSALSQTTNPITVSAAATTQFVVSGLPSTITAGVPTSFTVAAEDTFGNLTPVYSGSVKITSSDPAASLPTNQTLAAGVGAFTVTLKTAGVQTLTATDTANSALNQTSNPISVNPAATAQFVLSGVPTTATAGVPTSFTVTAQDTFGNLTPAFAGSIKITSSDLAASLPASHMLAAGVGTFTVTLKTAGLQTLTATDTVNSTLSQTSNPITVIAGAATQYKISAPATEVAGQPINFTVTALDSFGNTATSYTGTVGFTTSSALDTLPSPATLSSGQGVFTATLNSAGTQTITATDTMTSSIVVGTSNNITVTPGATTNFAIVGTPSILVAGSNATFTVTAEDTFGNITTAYSGSVKITSSDLAASLPASHTLTAGVGTFTVTLKTAGLQTLTATDTANSTLSQISNPITVSAAATAQLVLSGVPANATAGAAISFTVTAEDTFGNLTPTFAGSIKITSSDPAASLPASHTLVAGVGTFTVTLKTAGLQTLTAADTATSALSQTTNPITVSAAATTQFVVSGLPSTITAGVPTSFTVAAEDTFGNLTPVYSGSVKITSSDPAASLPTNQTLAAGVGAFTVTLKTAGVQTLTATDTANSALNQTSNPISVNPAATAQFVLSGVPTTATAGVPTSFTVTAQDTFGNLTPAYAGSVKITSSDLTAALPASHTLAAGVGTFTVTLKTAGLQTLTATDTATSALSQTTNPITVGAAATTQLVLSGLPSTIPAGVPASFTVTAEDPFGNLTPTYAGNVQITSSDPAASLPASKTLAAGVGTFTVTLKTAGLQTLTATDTATSALSQTSNPISVNPAATAQFVLSAVPSTITAGVPTSFTVTAEDTFGNLTPAYAGSVKITSSDLAASLPASHTLTAGVGTFTVTLKTAGLQTLTATDTATSALSQTTNPITVSAAATSQFVLSGVPTTTTAGMAINFTVTAEDSFGNFTPAYSGSVKITSSDPAAVLPVSNALAAGVGTFTVTLNTAGPQTLTIADSANRSLNQTSNPITVSPGVATHFVVAAQSKAVAGQTFSFTVTALDASGNIATGYAGIVKITSSDPAASLPANNALAAGLGTFAVTLDTAGPQTLTATDTANSVLSQTSNPITVNAGATTQFVVSSVPAIAGVATTVTVTAEDQFGNITPAYNGTVKITTSDAAAVLPPTNTLTAGVGTFTVILETAGPQTLTATDTTNSALSQTSNPITVNAGATTQFVVSSVPAIAGVATTVTVTAEDQFGNITPAYSGIVRITSSDAAAVLPANNTLVAGLGTFAVVLETAGPQTVTATDTANNALNQTTKPITVSAAATSKLVLSACRLRRACRRLSR